MPLICFYNGDWLSEPSNHKDFCHKYINTNKDHLNKCHDCHASWEKEVKRQKKPIICKCYGGMSGLAVPILIQGNYFGCILSGQFLLEPLTDKITKKIIKNLNLNPQDIIIDDLKKIKILTIEKLNIIMELLYLTGNSFASMAYSNMKLSELGLDYKIINNDSIKKLFPNNNKQTKKGLTEREYEILKFITDGKNNNEIAKELFISVHTAKAHVSSIIEKFEVKDRVQVAVKATKENLV